MVAHGEVDELVDVVEVVVHRTLGERAGLRDRACCARGQTITRENLFGRVDDLLTLAAAVGLDHWSRRCHVTNLPIPLPSWDARPKVGTHVPSFRFPRRPNY